MAQPSRSPAEILASTLRVVDSCTTAIQQVVEENLSPGSSPRSVSANMVLLEIERIAEHLEGVVLEANAALQAREPEPEFSDDEKVSTDDRPPCDYEGPNREFSDFSDQEGYDTDRSPKYGYRDN